MEETEVQHTEYNDLRRFIEPGCAIPDELAALGELKLVSGKRPAQSSFDTDENDVNCTSRPKTVWTYHAISTLKGTD